MNYLIESSGFKKDENGNITYFQLLKIGYSKSNSGKDRFSSYVTDNPTSIVLYTIPDLTMEDEKRIQYYFKDYVLDHGYSGNEWFYYKKEIVEFFEKLSKSSNEEVRSKIDSLPIAKYKNPNRIRIKDMTIIESDSIKSKLKVSVKQVLSKVLKNSFREVDNIVVDLIKKGIYSDNDEFFKYMETHYGKDVVTDFNNRINKLSSIPKLKKYAEKFYSKGMSVVDKYKLLCEDISVNCSKEEIDIVLSLIPDTDPIKSNYIALGPKELKAAAYKKAEIERRKENILFDKDKIAREIFLRFSIGDVVPLIIIKRILIDIYSKVGYSKSAIGGDLYGYFNIRETAVRRDVDGSGIKKRVKSYELLSPKDEYIFLYIYNQVKSELK